MIADGHSIQYIPVLLRSTGTVGSARAHVLSAIVCEPLGKLYGIYRIYGMVFLHWWLKRTMSATPAVCELWENGTVSDYSDLPLEWQCECAQQHESDAYLNYDAFGACVLPCAPALAVAIVSCWVLFLFSLLASTADEYVPYAADVARAHNERVRDAFARVAKSARVHYIDANHDLSDMKAEDVEGFVDFIFS